MQSPGLGSWSRKFLVSSRSRATTEVVLDSSPDDGADPEAGVLGLQLGDAGVDGGGVVEDILLASGPRLHLNQGDLIEEKQGVLILPGWLQPRQGRPTGPTSSWKWFQVGGGWE